MRNIKKISAVIVVKNAEKTIAECLDSLQQFDEIILLDNISTDKTIEIAETYKNTRIFSSEFIGFGPLKNLAISYAKNDWIFSIDSDEVVEPDLLDAINTADLDSKIIYQISRKNLYDGEWIKACGWYPDFISRLFCKSTTRFNDNQVHESLIIPHDCKKIRLGGYLRHYAFDNSSALLGKLQHYSTLWAEQNGHKKSSFGKSIFKGLWTFVKNYIFSRGFLYGYKGFLISYCNGNGAFFKYVKLYEKTLKKPTISLIVTTYNQKERLTLVLDSIKHQSLMPLEVIVADDGSKEDTRELIDSYKSNFPAKLIHAWQEDRGFRASASRNMAIDMAAGDYIILIDGDMILNKNFIFDHQLVARRKTIIQGGRIILDKNATDQMLVKNNFALAYDSFSFKAMRLCFISPIILEKSTISASIFDKIDFIKGIRSCNMSFFKSDALAINGFCEDFVGWGREDSEFVARFLFNGGYLQRLKFSGIAYHLYHNENNRAMLEKNHQIYEETIANKKTWCANGLLKI